MNSAEQFYVSQYEHADQRYRAARMLAWAAVRVRDYPRFFRLSGEAALWLNRRGRAAEREIRPGVAA